MEHVWSIILASAAFLCHLHGSLSEDCGEGNWTYSPSVDHCYLVIHSDIPYNWTIGEDNCLQRQAHLASPWNKVENDIVTEVIRQAGAQSEEVWIGLFHPVGHSHLNYTEQRRVGWQWTSGANYTYTGPGSNAWTAWAPHEPGGYESWTRMNNGLWKGIGQDYSQYKYAICQKDPLKSTTTSTTLSTAMPPTQESTSTKQPTQQSSLSQSATTETTETTTMTPSTTPSTSVTSSTISTTLIPSTSTTTATPTTSEITTTPTTTPSTSTISTTLIPSTSTTTATPTTTKITTTPTTTSFTSVTSSTIPTTLTPSTSTTVNTTPLISTTMNTPFVVSSTETSSTPITKSVSQVPILTLLEISTSTTAASTNAPNTKMTMQSTVFKMSTSAITTASSTMSSTSPSKLTKSSTLPGSTESSALESSSTTSTKLPTISPKITYVASSQTPAANNSHSVSHVNDSFSLRWLIPVSVILCLTAVILGLLAFGIYFIKLRKRNEDKKQLLKREGGEKYDAIELRKFNDAEFDDDEFRNPKSTMDKVAVAFRKILRPKEKPFLYKYEGEDKPTAQVKPMAGSTKVTQVKLSDLELFVNMSDYKQVIRRQFQTLPPTVENTHEDNPAGATYVDSFHRKNTFIVVSESPKSAWKDIWATVWDRSVEHIMQFGNSNKEKAKDLSDGIVRVSIQQEKVYDNVVTKILNLQKCNESRTIKQYSFNLKPDPGCSSYRMSLLKFRALLRQTSGEGAPPVFIYDCQGNGMAGTFLALDSLVDESSQSYSVDVMTTLSKLRQQTPTCESLDHLDLIYQVILEDFQSKTTCIHLDVDEDSSTA